MGKIGKVYWAEVAKSTTAPFGVVLLCGTKSTFSSVKPNKWKSLPVKSLFYPSSLKSNDFL